MFVSMAQPTIGNHQLQLINEGNKSRTWIEKSMASAVTATCITAMMEKLKQNHRLQCKEFENAVK